MVTSPSFAPEAGYWQQGIKLIAGIDETGMGALAGPVVAAAVIFDPHKIPPTLPLSREEKPKEWLFIPYRKYLREPAQHYRRNPTPAEKAFWCMLHDQQFKRWQFLRQKPLDRFIVDFYCSQLALVIEIDGGVHKKQWEYDTLRSEELKDYGIDVIRYTNDLVLHKQDWVKNDLLGQLEKRTYTPLDKGGQGGFLIRDSKTLSASQREVAAVWIKANALAWAVGEASVEEINTLNIRAASHIAMRRAVDALSLQPELLLIDGHPASPHPAIPARNLIKGDRLSFSIAAASILAKIHRDTLMVELHAAFPSYNFAGHKGYGTKTHLQALRDYGPNSEHRIHYAPVMKVISLPCRPVMSNA